MKHTSVKDVHELPSRANRGWFERIVSWLEERVDDMPRSIKAIVAILLLANGIKGLVLIGAAIFYAIVYIAVKAS